MDGRFEEDARVGCGYACRTVGESRRMNCARRCFRDIVGARRTRCDARAIDEGRASELRLGALLLFADAGVSNNPKAGQQTPPLERTRPPRPVTPRLRSSRSCARAAGGRSSIIPPPTPRGRREKPGASESTPRATSAVTTGSSSSSAKLAGFRPWPKTAATSPRPRSAGATVWPCPSSGSSG
jgi:hypothetical protein